MRRDFSILRNEGIFMKRSKIFLILFLIGMGIGFVRFIKKDLPYLSYMRHWLITFGMNSYSVNECKRLKLNRYLEKPLYVKEYLILKNQFAFPVLGRRACFLDRIEFIYIKEKLYHLLIEDSEIKSREWKKYYRLLRIGSPDIEILACKMWEIYAYNKLGDEKKEEEILNSYNIRAAIDYFKFLKKDLEESKKINGNPEFNYLKFSGSILEDVKLSYIDWCIKYLENKIRGR